MVKLSISYEIYFGEYLWIFVIKRFTMHEPHYWGGFILMGDWRIMNLQNEPALVKLFGTPQFCNVFLMEAIKSLLPSWESIWSVWPPFDVDNTNVVGNVFWLPTKRPKRVGKKRPLPTLQKNVTSNWGHTPQEIKIGFVTTKRCCQF